MNTPEPSCTAPERWAGPPSPDAQEAEIAAYLDHCTECAYHACLDGRDDEVFDRLLREACRDLSVPAGVGGGRLRRRPRPPGDRPALPAPGQRSAFEQGLLRASLAAFVIVVLWVAFTVRLHTPAVLSEAPPPAAPPTGWDAGTLNEAQLAAAVERGRLYTVRVISDRQEGQPTKSGVPYASDALYAAADRLPYGSRLQVINPVNGASVVVTVVDRGPGPGALSLSSAAADSLGFEGRLLAIVEILSRPSPPLLGP